MGIEIPPPKGGPAVFTASSPGNDCSVDLSPDEEHFIVLKPKDDLNDSGSVCLSEGQTTDSGGLYTLTRTSALNAVSQYPCNVLVSRWHH